MTDVSLKNVCDICHKREHLCNCSEVCCVCGEEDDACACEGFVSKRDFMDGNFSGDGD